MPYSESMRLQQWLEQEGRGEVSRLVRVANVAASTIYDHLGGKPIRLYDVAKRISDATGGTVSIPDLCEEPQQQTGPHPAIDVQHAATGTDPAE